MTVSEKAGDIIWRGDDECVMIMLSHIGSIDRRRPPQRKSSVGDLVEAGTLGIGQLLVLH